MRRKRSFLLGFAVVPIVALVGIPSAAARTDVSTTYQQGNTRAGYWPSSAVTGSNASKAFEQWSIQAGAPISAQPVAFNGVLYWGDWNGVEHATTTSGQPLWSTALGTTPNPPSCPFPLPTLGIVSTATVGVVGGQSRVWVGGGTGQLVSLDAATGRVLWQTQLGAVGSGILWSSPALYDGSIYEGVASDNDCPLVPGQVFRLDATTGAVQAVFTTVPSGCNGGGVWASPTVDSAEKAVFVATGNDTCGSTYQDSIIKLNATTLTVESSWQVPSDEMVDDGDFGATPMLFDARIGGHLRDLVGAENKNGIYYALDRTDLPAGPVWQARVSQASAMVECDTLSSSSWAGGSSPVVVAGVTYNGSACGSTVTAFNAKNGGTDWQVPIGTGPVLGSIDQAPGVVAVPAGDVLDLLSSSNGAVLLSFSEPGSAPFWSPASFDQSGLYIANSDGNLYSFGFTDRTPPTTVVIKPTNGAILSGDQFLSATAADNVGVTKVEFHLTGGSLNDVLIGTGTPTYYGWLVGWDSTTVPDGTYTLQSVAYDAAGNVGRSAGLSIVVDNTPPSTSVLVPKDGAQLAGTTDLDASASSGAGVSKVEFRLTGGSLNDALIATGTATYYGWLAQWDSTTVPDGTYTLQSVAYDVGGLSSSSAPVTVSVTN